MGQPVWQVRNSNLGTIAENIFFEYTLEAIDTDAGPVVYSLIAGELPEGIQLTGTQISGIPLKIIGVPGDVDEDTFSQFSIRATTTTNEVSDITFTLAVTGQKVPIILTPPGELADIYYGDFVNIEVEAFDQDTDDVLFWEVATGVLPDGLVLVQADRSVFIRGYPVPVSAFPIGVGLGFDGSKFDQNLGAFGFDYSAGQIDKNYGFILSVTDGIGYDSQTFSLFLKSTFNLTADSTEITADQLSPTADRTNKINPILLNNETFIGDFLHDNYFAYRFFGLDFEGDQIEFAIDSGTVPPNLVLNATTGWLYGILDTITGVSEDFAFDIIVYKVSDPTHASVPTTFTITIEGDLSGDVTFLNDNPMCIENGAVSTLAILGVPTYPTELLYTLVAGDLPPGLILDISGLIIGRPKFQSFTLDGGSTTFDGGSTGCDNLSGSFDNTFEFTVNVQDELMTTINVNAVFEIIVAPVNANPYEDLYLVSYPTIMDRIYFNQLADQDAVVPRADVFRDEDPFYGIAPDLRFILADGLNAASKTEYADALEQNHNRRKFGFNELKIAEARGGADQIIYEVIYTEMIDKLEEDNGNISIGSELVLNNVSAAEVIAQGGVPTFNSDGEIIIYPASITNMRNRILSEIGQVSNNTLPLWMTSIQSDTGRALGWIPACPIVYCKPGTAAQILFNINDSGFNIRQISFDVDRYVWDNNLSGFSLQIGQTEADYDGISPNGSFIGGDGVGGTAYAVLDEITLFSEAVIRVDAVDLALISQTEINYDGTASNGSFVGGDGAGGTAYVVSDTITLSDGSVITVDAIDGNDDVTDFTITTPSGINVVLGIALTQTSTSGTGTAFTLTPQLANVSGDVTEFTILDAGLNVLPLVEIDQDTTSGALLINSQDELDYNGLGDNGSFNGFASVGSYAVSDVITLSNGATVTVDAVSGSDVTDFTITSIGTAIKVGDTLTQTSVAPDTGQDGFTLTPGADNQTGGLGFTLTPGNATFEEVDEGDSILKFPKTNVFS